MGIYDREYLRDESSGTGLFGGVSPVTKSIIFISFAVFLLENLLRWDSGGITVGWLAASPQSTFRQLRLHELLTNTFVHMGPSVPIGLIFDMWFFWIIGRDMESIYGSRDFLAFYLVSAVLTTVAGLVVAMSTDVDQALIFGSWGPILAVMTLYTMYYPRREFLFLFFIPMPMWVLLSIYILIPLLGHFSGTPTPGIGVGMILAGVGFAYAFKQMDLRWSRLVSARRFRPRLKIFSGSTGAEAARPKGWSPSRPSAAGGGGRPASVSVLPEDQLDARVDEILAKIARDGRDTLSDDEQRILQEASRRARIRRSDRI